MKRCSKILEILKQEIVNTEDKVYPASYQNKEGYISLVNKKLIFFELKGFFQPKYIKVFEIPFSKIDSLDDVSHNKIVITELNGKRHYLTVYNFPPPSLTKTLTDLIINDMISSRIKKQAD